MRNVFFLLVLAMLFSTHACNEKEAIPPDPHDARRIDGDWVSLTATLVPDPHWHYHFEQGLLTQEYRTLGTVLSTLTYPYAIRQDTILIGGDATNAPRWWVVYFECDEVVEVVESTQPISPQFWLKREQ